METKALSSNVTVEHEHRGRLTTSRILWDGEEVASGTALRSKADVVCDAVGEMIASGRAFQEFGRFLEQIGHESCVTKEEMRRALFVQRSFRETSNPLDSEIPEACHG
jgi:hypothetical protein